jgi:allantoin racemase
MRIWHQGFIEMATVPAYVEALARHILAVAAPDTVVDVHGVAPGTYTPGHTAADIARSPYLMSLHVHQILDAARTAAREGYDAMAIAILQDGGLREARSLVDLPVAGYGETAMHVACMLGRRFSVVLFNPYLADLVDEEIARAGLGSRAAPHALVDVEYANVVEAFAKPGRLVDAFTSAARRALAGGADVLIPGQTIMAEVLWQNGVHRIDAAPVVDAVGVTVKMAELLAGLRRSSGMSASRRGYWGTPPDAELAERARHLLGRER